MSFQPVNLVLLSVPPVPGQPLILPRLWSYLTTDNTVAEVSAAGYFNIDSGQLLQDINFNVGDQVYCVCSNGNVTLTLTSVSSTATTTTAAAASAGSVDTAAIDDLAVTNAKIAANAVDTSKLALNTIQFAQVAMTAAEWNGMYAAPKLILAAPGAGLIYQIDSVWYDMAFVSTQYAAGGVVNLQFDSTINGAGVLATQDVAAATITGLAASSIVRPAIGISAIAQSTTVNKGLYMSNKTAAFTTGNSTWKVNVAYRIITA